MGATQRAPPTKAARGDAGDTQIVVRVDARLAAAIDAAVEAERAQRPGERVTRSDIIRRALARAFLNAGGR